MGSTQPVTITKVLLVGANGTLGSALLTALVEAECFEVSILLRSVDPPPRADMGAAAAAPRVVVVSPSMNVDELVTACTGQDAVIAAFQIHDISHHLNLAEASFMAGVRRFIPADFGSCESWNPVAQRYFPMYGKKTVLRNKYQELAQRAIDQGKPFTWTSIVNGHFFDYGLEDKLLHFDLDTHVARILDGGNIRASSSTLRRVSEAVVRVLQRYDETRNRALYIQSFCPTQLEVLAALERATGTKWRTEHLESKQYLEENSQLLATDYHKASFSIVFVLGTMDADWTRRDGFAMELLGLEDEDLDHVVAAVVAKKKVNANAT